MAAYDPSGLPDMEVEEDVNGNEEVAYQQDDDGDEDDDYDPSSFTFGGDSGDATPQQDATMADSAQAPASNEGDAAQQVAKPKTVGGFIVEESDEEDDDEEDGAPAPSQLNGTEGTQSGLGAVAVAEATAAAAGQDVSLASEPTQDSAAALPAQASLNGSTAHVSDVLASPSAVVPASSLPIPETDQAGKNGTPVVADSAGAASVTGTPKPPVNGVAVPPVSQPVPATLTTSRLPFDKVGRLEDRIKEDPKADTQAWLELIAYYRDKDQNDQVRKVYDRMLEVFPTSPAVWHPYLHLEIELAEGQRVDNLFGRCLFNVPNVDLWSIYLDYLRRKLPLIPDPQGENRTTITNAFETVLEHVGNDPDAGKVWREYVDFVKSGPGVIGGVGWQDQQKGDLVRKAYQRAIKVPTSELLRLWKEYDGFENSFNKQQGRKNITEQSPHYMSARSMRIHLDKIFIGLDRRGVPVLPPLYGFEGEEAFAEQVEKFRAWVELEIDDPLALKEDEPTVYRKRVLNAYKQSTIQLRFYPTIWFDAAQWCFEQVAEDMVGYGDDFLDHGLLANPESVLLALKKADRIESTLDQSNIEDVIVANGEKLDVPFENAHKALYGLREKIVEREKKGLLEIREHFASLAPEDETADNDNDEDDDDDDDDARPNIIAKPIPRQAQLDAQLKALTNATRAHLELLKRTISYVWVAKMRAFRRVQGQGGPNKVKKGFRGVFHQSRPRGQLSSDVYITSALIEWNCYKDASAHKIFERGLKLFPTDEGFALEYIRFLIGLHDYTNARVVFETTLTKILGPGGQAQFQPPDEPPTNKREREAARELRVELDKKRDKLRPLLMYMHNFESDYGDLVQMQKLERRLKDLFPGESEMARFGHRFAMPSFDGLTVQVVISPTQARLKAPTETSGAMGGGPQEAAVLSVEGGNMGQGNLRLGPNGPYVASPKRPLDLDGEDEGPARNKFARGDSPLKGAAGRRITHHTANPNSSSASASMNASNSNNTGAPGFSSAPKHYAPPLPPPPPTLPREVTFLLSILPHASAYHAVTFDPTRVVDFLRGLNVEAARGRVQGLSGGGYGGR